ncbi:MAG: HisA/HisF-related TIM barrel protein [Planctomycetaceae bacterium]
MNPSLPLMGVIDLCDGRAVHAIAGQRERYREVVCTGVRAGDAVGLADRYRQLGIGSLYVADLGAILSQSPHLQLVAALCSLAENVLIDAGPSAGRFANLLADGRARVVIPTESFATVDDWAAICDSLDGATIALGIDLSGTRIRHSGNRSHSDTPTDSLVDNVSPWIERASSLGVASLVVLDLAFVGTRQGAGTIDACRQISQRWPAMELISGGGVRNASDVRALLTAGCDQVLVATALHDDAAAQRLTEELATIPGGQSPHAQPRRERP